MNEGMDEEAFTFAEYYTSDVISEYSCAADRLKVFEEAEEDEEEE